MCQVIQLVLLKSKQKNVNKLLRDYATVLLKKNMK